LAELTKRHEFGRFDVKMGKVIGGEEKLGQARMTNDEARITKE
jgi:hypothetical protein